MKHCIEIAEKAEIQCEYCEKNSKNKDLINTFKMSKKADSDSGIQVNIRANILYVESAADTYEPNYQETDTFINYCPMCGRKLV